MNPLRPRATGLWDALLGSFNQPDRITAMPSRPTPLRPLSEQEINLPLQSPVMTNMSAMADQALGQMEAGTTAQSFPPAPPEVPQQPAEEPSMFSNLYESTLGDEEWRLRKAMALNSMRLNPDQALTASLGAQLKDVRALRTQKQAGQRTAEVLREKNPQIAALLDKGVIDAKTALSIAYKNPNQIQSLMQLYKDDPVTFQKMAQAGAFGGDVDLGQGMMYDTMAKKALEARNELIQGGRTARGLMNNLMRFQMNSEGIETGPLEDRLQALRQFGASIGVPVDETALARGQSLRAASLLLVAEELRKNKGPQTDFDAKFTENFVPGLGNTTQANQEITNYMLSANRIMTIYGGQATDMPYTVKEADTFVNDLQQKQQDTPAVTKFDGEWITFEEYYQDAKQESRATGASLTDAEILEKWLKDHKEKGEL